MRIAKGKMNYSHTTKYPETSGVMLGAPTLLLVHPTFFINSKITLWLIHMICTDELDP